MHHDSRYHAILASGVSPSETAQYVAIGDILHSAQKRYNFAVKEFNQRHKEHVRLLPKFRQSIEKLPKEIQSEAIREALGYGADCRWR